MAATAAACDNANPKVTSKPSASTTSSDTVSTGAATTTTALSEFATLYLDILGPADAVSGKFFASLEKLPSTATGADAQKIATPAANAIDAADQRLLRVPWPANVAGEVHALVLANARLIRDLRDVGAQKRVASGAWKNQFESDVANVTKQVSLVVAELHTPTTSS